MSDENREIGSQDIREVLNTIAKPKAPESGTKLPPNPVLQDALSIVESLYPGEALNGKNILEILASNLTARKHGFESSILSPTAGRIVELQSAMIKELNEWGVSNVTSENSLAQLATAYKQMLEVKAGRATLPLNLNTSIIQSDVISSEENSSTQEPQVLMTLQEDAQHTTQPEKQIISETVNKSFSTVKNFLISQGMYDEKRHGHLENTADLNKIVKLSILEMSTIGKSYGMSEENAGTLPALYAGKIGDQDFDMVLIRNDIPDNIEMITHEFMHRATAKGSQAIGTREVTDQIYIALGFPKERRVLFKASQDKKEKAELLSASQKVSVINEALTQWTTRKAHDLHKINTGEILYHQDDRAYRHQVHAIDELRNNILIKGRHFSPEKADAFILDAAVTGDFSKWSQLFGDTILPIVFEGINDDYLLSLYDEILGTVPPSEVET